MARILIIDDEPSIRRSVRKVLELSGHLADETAEGLVGIAMHQAHPYEIIITDLRMPDCDGLQVIASLRAFDERVSIILITGDGHGETSVKATELGGVWVLPKPFSMQELERMLQDIVAKVKLT